MQRHLSVVASGCLQWKRGEGSGGMVGPEEGDEALVLGARVCGLGIPWRR